MIIKYLCNGIFMKHVNLICEKYCTNYKDMKSYFKPKRDKVDTLMKLQKLLFIIENDPEEHFKQVFRDFSFWFLQKSFIRIILNDKKWFRDTKKCQDYVDYKNNRYMNFLIYPER
jgi:hypothetical protein